MEINTYIYLKDFNKYLGIKAVTDGMVLTRLLLDIFTKHKLTELHQNLL